MTDSPDDRPYPLEAAWFVEHHHRVIGAARRLSQAHNELDGALTVAHARGDDEAAAQVVKYEIEAGLLIALVAFRSECLAAADINRTPRLTTISAMITETVSYIDDHLSQLTRVRTADPIALVGTHRRLRDTSVTLDNIIDDCLDSIFATPTSNEG